MQKLVFNQIINEMYIGIVTILDYETSLRKCLSEFIFCAQGRSERKIIVDLALKSGINKYRFVTYNITDRGEVLWDSSENITPSNDIIEYANLFLKQKKDIICNSMLPSTTKVDLLNS